MNYANSAASTAPALANPIPAAMQELGSAIHEMGALSDALANRLVTVLMPVGPQPAPTSGGAQPAAAPPMVSPQTDEIHHFRRRVEAITAQLQDVQNRLEV